MSKITKTKKEEIHERMKKRFLPKKFKSTTELGIGEFSEYMNNVKNFAEKRARKYNLDLKLDYFEPPWK